MDLYTKYNLPIPRYTSYPTVPHWSESFLHDYEWKTLVREALMKNKDNGLSLYIHLPYCEKLCTYCGCNKRITVNHDVEGPYIDLLKKEFLSYVSLSPSKLKISEIHLGGGTPTFFSSGNLKELIQFIKSHSQIEEGFELAFEGHPNNTTFEHLKVLKEEGSNRVSLGIQDFDIKVQTAINRIQPFDKVKQVTEEIRKLQYSSLNYDLIYGLPFQTLQVLEDTMDKVIALKPDRIAFYSYAHVPWKAKSQRGYSDSDLPDNKEKRALYELGKEMLTNKDYEEIGMDHFALPGDLLLQKKHEGKLNRNFMGYTTTQNEILIGLGVSSISDLGIAYGQNEKTVESYASRLENEGLAITKGIKLTLKDMEVREVIKELICNGQVSLKTISDSQQSQLNEMQLDGLLEFRNGHLRVLEPGKPFIRNICAVFDQYYESSTQGMYSKSI